MIFSFPFLIPVNNQTTRELYTLSTNLIYDDILPNARVSRKSLYCIYVCRKWLKSQYFPFRCYVSVAVLDGCIYAMGGFDGHVRQNTAERYTPNNNQWSLIAPMNQQRSDANASTLNGKYSTVTGGNRTKLPSSRWRRRGRSLREVFACSCFFATTDLSQIYNRETRRHGTPCTKTIDS